MTRVLVALETTDDPKYARRRELVETTWARRLPSGFDFGAFTGSRLHVPDDYYGLTRKTKAIAHYARRCDYDWLLIVDDDVFIRTERLRPPPWGYAGLVLADRAERWCSGGCYWLDREAISLVADAPFNPLIAPSAEDRWVGWVLRQRGIEPFQWGVALKPCYCGYCVPDPEPDDLWTAYIIDPQYSEEKFLEFERRYGATSPPASPL